MVIITWHTTSKYIYFKSKCVIDSIYIYIYIYVYEYAYVQRSYTHVNIFISSSNPSEFGHQTIMSCVRDYVLSYHFFVCCMPGICLRVLIILYPDREYDMWYVLVYVYLFLCVFRLFLPNLIRHTHCLGFRVLRRA